MVVVSASAAEQAVQRRTLRVLTGSQVMGGVGVAVGVTVGALIAEELSGSATLAGLAATASVLGGALAAVPLARLMSARGRRAGLAAGYLTGAAGAGLAVTAVRWDAYWLLLVGLCLFGSSTTANLQARYAATDLADGEHRARALSTVVWATTVGAVAGPNLAEPAGWTGQALGLPDLAGPFLWSGIAFLVAGLIVFARLRPDPLLTARARRGVEEPTVRHGSLRHSLAVVRASPPALLGLATIAISHTVMVGVMTMTPVHLDHGGARLSVVGFVISMHVAGMYAFSPVVGWASDRYGRVPVILAGQVVLLTALVLAGNAAQEDAAQLATGLFLLGFGWSAGLIAGSTLLTEAVPEPARPGVQGGADLVMGLGGASGGAVAGVVVGWAGFGVLNAAASALVLTLAVLAGRAALASRPAS
jgi:MFS family permease